MTVCAKSDETLSMKSTQNRNSVVVAMNRPSFMITDILSKAADREQHREHLTQLNEKFATAANSHSAAAAAMALNRGFGMLMPQRLDTTQTKHDYYDSDGDEFHGSDDVDGSSIGSGGECFCFFFFFF